MAERKYHFDITPHIVKQLGEQLVPDEVTALLELIKNSYDADATYVSIEINTSGQYLNETVAYPNHKGFIVVEDDGFGMSEDTILKSWLVISYSAKRDFKEKGKKTPQGRTPLGDKGLGRLSTQRLANICEIYTNEDLNSGTHLAFNWKDFETQERLSEVSIESDSFRPTKPHGTKLILSNINFPDVWKGNNLERFKGQVSQLLSPYKENRPFEVYISINGIVIDLEKSNEEIRDLAISRFTFNFDGESLSINGKTKLSKFRGNTLERKDDFNNFMLSDDGKKFGEYLLSKYSDIELSDDNKYYLKIEQVYSFNTDIPKLENIIVFDDTDDDEKTIKANPGPFEGLIDEFNFDELTKNETMDVFGQKSNYKIFTQNQVGIKIFRNGFSVLPYGIDGQDWLKLSESQTKTSFYDIRPSNVIGYFAIDEDKNRYLKEKTDRQGFISNPYSNNFFLLSNFIKDQINIYHRKIRRRYDEFLREYKTENNGIQTVTESFQELNNLSESTNEIINDTENAIVVLDNTVKEQAIIVDEVENNSIFSSEEHQKDYERAKVLLERLKKIQEVFNKLQNIVNKTKKLNEVIDILEPKIQILEEQLENFSELASLGLTTESVSHEFASIADRLAERASFYTSKLQNKKLSDSDIYVLMEYINSTVNGLKIQLKHLDPALKYNKEKKSSISLSDLFEEEKEYYSNRFAKNDIEFKIDSLNDFDVKINKGKLIQIIDNLLNNSEFWLIEKKNNEPNFNPIINIKIDKPWVYISDNGYGITPAIENQIFEPFVTTKPKGRGRGLGLFIVQQLLDSSGCTIALESEKNDLKRKFVFAINLSNIIDN
ncbi:ATP-binding protein [Elizabethkingia anophelis]|uniref:ATP-binding protein n=1 Tax=Elizabethkingia anophelis TaxID=1117645 RepID=UPI0023EA1FD2|nr:ATP-binding protein [Elizabethkingia anophelis]MCT4228951.1 ATP-binding protein [Elizabethkingia anophelis]MCT4239677.1 ATP-binding protein [Elizabethkingia anophelis]MCT4281752.1 ATP-binding protein [Elizabethkingia anophelis]MCT4292337.1 ATP-binding protein [Elizabethkingia anophelis]GJN57105.1 histidine kinase [Elizabethkingia anophelis]